MDLQLGKVEKLLNPERSILNTHGLPQYQYYTGGLAVPGGAETENYGNDSNAGVRNKLLTITNRISLNG